MYCIVTLNMTFIYTNQVEQKDTITTKQKKSYLVSWNLNYKRYVRAVILIISRI